MQTPSDYDHGLCRMTHKYSPEPPCEKLCPSCKIFASKGWYKWQATGVAGPEMIKDAPSGP